ncbi:glycosyltransferase family 4 protein [uncultured Marixanthomonas sp.]|uniref:glycosyltransferase family 4 protein n=1 Tax=uncultured Marixanthomonas sp. TaxID=757245 RepID=UPI0030D9021B|tara:strand:- start:42317 stop:43510 length:1194 start_codon:yes stop_codon:yes gene_type:complete
MKILIFDGSFKTTPFINRLMKGLVQEHQVFVLGYNERLSRPIPGVHYISLGSNQNKLRFVTTTLSKVLCSKKMSFLLPTIKRLALGKRKALQQQNLDLTIQTIAPDVIHLQWPSVIPWFESILLEKKIPVVLSQRGFHSNVRPFVDQENFNYLKTWFPYITGFHSVSKAISINGDKVWESPNKIDSIIYTGVAINQISFHSTYKVLQPIQLLSIGRPHWVKGYDYALQACKLLKEQGLAFHYTIIGGKGDEELQFLIHDLGLQNSVTLENRLPQTAVFKNMRNASLLLMPSLEEGLPNVLVEAMAVGLPVLSTNCGGVPELIEHGVNGWMIPIRNPTAMAEGILNFTNLSENEIESVRRAARKKIEKQHNEAQMIKDMVGFYSMVVERATKPMNLEG